MTFNANDARDLIMKRYLNPQNAASESEKDLDFKFKQSQTCADSLWASLKWDGDLLVDVKTKSEGCAIFRSSTDILIDVLKNKTKQEISQILKTYEDFIERGDMTEEESELLGPLWVFYNVKKHLSRISCSKIFSDLIKNDL
ncbi:iron-sulfur cluster assembly scaffold protein [Mycoplasma sp. Ms02]|uniref:iron-sulfur cluster assembly scaffold protein n=1 Tax=Mycoplasma sp. Ms02 TaxID=353851 RepID=UPI001C8A59A7|nr:iron-sulfur cluster assembly scaffold protein [Mycoplasma sp. Ms02]QZE12406.1 iron-sulfur cluster assembly scaffold protein [Mycoplasma sp. Ms02]